MQRIAPCYDVDGLISHSFQGVKCHDLSTTGISFLWPGKPAFSVALISLELPHGKIVVKVQVVHAHEFDSDTGEYHVGCRFLERESSA